MSATTRPELISRKMQIPLAGGTVFVTLDAPVSEVLFNDMLVTVTTLVNRDLLPELNQLLREPGIGNLTQKASYTQSFGGDSFGSIRLRAHVRLDRPVNTGELHHVLAHAFAEAHTLVSFLELEDIGTEGESGANFLGFDPFSDEMLNLLQKAGPLADLLSSTLPPGANRPSIGDAMEGFLSGRAGSFVGSLGNIFDELSGSRSHDKTAGTGPIS